MKEAMKKVWLVTGAAGGLGRCITEAALAQGDCSVATDRDEGGLTDYVTRFGASVRTAVLDVRDEPGARRVVQSAHDAFGRIDVLVNNAGYGEFAPFEQVPSDAFKAMIDVCFLGVVNLTRAALPGMRQQRSGTIINISSLGGRLATAGSASYHAAKWAVGGFTESLAQEVAPFGVRVCAVEPGSMRTNWGKNAGKAIPTLIPEYEESVGKVQTILSSLWGREKNDPKKVAAALIQLANAPSVPMHLILGKSALEMAAKAEAARQADAEKWRALSESTDVDS
jgi:NAD(P)-dependent dehydrogenase (short-subunit alcohol dehydrogenase family)